MSTVATVPGAAPVAGLAPGGRVVIPTWLGGCLLAVAAAAPFEGDRIALLAMVAPMSWCLFARRDRAAVARISWPVLLFLLWLALTMLWSVDGAQTASSVLKMALLTLLGTLVSAGRSVDGLMDVIARCGQVALTASWVLYFALPDVGRNWDGYESGAMRGIFVHRNTLGYFAALITITTLVRWARGPRRLLSPSLAWACLALVSTVMSQSRTAWSVLGVTAALALVMLAMRGLRRPARLSAVAVLVVLVGALVRVALNPEQVVTGLGRDATLTGRTEIWGAVVTGIIERPFLGYGWGALWRAGSPATEALWAEAGFAFHHAHNGYLDSAAQAGLIGMSLGLLVVATGLWRALRSHVHRGSWSSTWVLLVLAAVLVFNMTEAVAFTGMSWVLLVSFCLVAHPWKEHP